MKNEVSEQTKINRFALFGWSITVAVIVVAYLLEVIKGQRTIGYYSMVVLLGVLPLLIGWFIYRKDQENRTIRYWCAYGYSILYAYVLLTGDTILTFVFIFPMIAVLLIYSDPTLLRNLAILNVVINLLHVVIKVVLFGMRSEDNIADYEIEVFAVLLVLVISYLASSLTGEINRNRLETIQKQSQRQEEVLTSVLDATEVLNERVSHIDQRAKDIEQQSVSAQVSIEEIATGTADVADNVQQQLSMSNGISDELESLTQISQDIHNKFYETHQMSQDGMQNVENLSESTRLVAQSKDDVSIATETLVSSLREAQEILSLIRSITDQTNLLSLNASIEAARAGEQGKGFAVVAGEIQKLSGDTGDATDKISEILEAIAVAAKNVNSAVANLDEVSNRQNELVEKTDEQFRVIDGNISDMTDALERQSNFLTMINENNVKIAGSISNTSAYTQELTASSENTMNMTKESLEGTKAMTKSLNEILQELQKLQEITNQD